MKSVIKHKKIIATIMAFAVIVTALAATNPVLFGKIAKATGELSGDEKRVVEEISNMTGVKTEEIIKLKNEGRSWNDVLDTIKKRNLSSTQGDRDARAQLLTNSGLGEDDVKKLMAEGYTEKEISEGKMLAERILFQLQQISEDTGELPTVPRVEITDKKEDKEDTAAYRDIVSKFDLKTAVYLMIKLKEDFGSVEKVMDEYLYSLQLGINLETYRVDKKGYEKEKQEKSAVMDMQKVITMSKIEAKMLEKLQKQNAANQNKGFAETGASKGGTEAVKTVDAPKSPLPEIIDTKPKNPADEIMKEVNDIKAKSFNFEGR